MSKSKPEGLTIYVRAKSVGKDDEGQTVIELFPECGPDYPRVGDPDYNAKHSQFCKNYNTVLMPSSWQSILGQALGRRDDIQPGQKFKVTLEPIV